MDDNKEADKKLAIIILVILGVVAVIGIASQLFKVPPNPNGSAGPGVSSPADTALHSFERFLDQYTAVLIFLGVLLSFITIWFAIHRFTRKGK